MAKKEVVNSTLQKLDLSFVEKHSFEGTDIYFEMNALLGELGELANIVKKERYAEEFPRYKKQLEEQYANGRPNFRAQKVDEAGDVLFYFIKVLNMMDIPLEEVVTGQKMKLDKLSQSYGHTFQK